MDTLETLPGLIGNTRKNGDNGHSNNGENALRRQASWQVAICNMISQAKYCSYENVVFLTL